MLYYKLWFGHHIIKIVIVIAIVSMCISAFLQYRTPGIKDA